MTNDELDAIEALANAATPGPWRVDDNGSMLLAPGDDWEGVLSCCNMNEGTVVFVAASRTAIPALVAEVRRLRALVGEA